MKNAFYLICLLITLNACSQKINNKAVLSDLKELSDDKYEGRKTGTPGNNRAAQFIIDRFKKAGLFSYYADYKQPIEFKNKAGETINGNNIIGYIKGKTDKVMVISAHYDHLGIKNGKIFNGADDDASGVVAVLAYADYFAKHQPNYSMVFAAFDAEEMGLQGSKYFVAHPPVSLRNIAININMDMIAHNDKNELYACGTFQFPHLKPFITSSNHKPNILFGHDDPKTGHDDWTYQSDQGSFYAKNIPFIYFGVEDHKDYHKETDEFQNINQDFFVGSVNTILEIIKNIDKNYVAANRVREDIIMD
ncbi:M28 family peptidase [Pedobacter sp. SD-b]|uniref:M28 family peptidase n=1 Tax=Pedobacter segetis TaxID=2793069 RepID=A0ABS1BHT1_9SPHI|nr:M28 family peptidase [Pedobacter segetis]MBK0382445.1 M28 family peptidase [Pedobacter segetis]